jgi:hypothetical protein
LVWGITASDDPWGYYAHEPISAADNGTITPTAALSAMPYTPDQSKATLSHFYYTYGSDLWGEFGFKDAFNLDENWFATSYLAIDQGTIAPMIENYRTQLCWNNFMANPEIPTMLESIGWVVGIEDDGLPPVGTYSLSQNYPNPFNAETIIHFILPKSATVNLEVYSILGERVAVIYQGEKFETGAHKVTFNNPNLASGLYFYKLETGKFKEIKKMLLIK